MTGDGEFDWLSFALGLFAGVVLSWILNRRRKLQIEPVQPIEPRELHGDLKALVLLYRADGRKIEAIKLVREQLDCDLRTAKYLVEHVR
ncbi:hypothetical protein DXH95_12340 [Sphingorhabdus pulchriflava]|jgi:hypothetical protein|uniref:Ribosomal protein L7/L12 C-terminal domain-containing protein n=1 Tax=Sphingorhabdus pulchriflava TaxID=2292257 RepID=A0A371B572_9SPHN|nr:hypothetical protein [Sphingorhabdus pulchriflava]RDV02729.1 hypothetical protein DXH95_12340 [Sphingorhabdus pulchriflava]